MPAASELHTLLDAATHHEEPVIRGVAIRAGLLWWCPCDWFNGATEPHCGGCGTSREVARC
ncbi:hypothetical protein [Haloechinothrix halophila]|uniref:hypothetical protein n=1 Tax=Haloechinothrix halophila TaxID=1069073 RepID=UPI000411D285|nr:hypothetical protein [Haloechinothrix halophila]